MFEVKNIKDLESKTQTAHMSLGQRRYSKQTPKIQTVKSKQRGHRCLWIVEGNLDSRGGTNPGLFFAMTADHCTTMTSGVVRVPENYIHLNASLVLEHFLHSYPL